MEERGGEREGTEGWEEKKRARSAKVPGLLLLLLSFFPFSFPFFIIFFFARPSPRETLFTRTVRVVGGAALIDIPRVPFRATIPDFISSDLRPLFFLRNEKSSAFRTRDFGTNTSKREKEETIFRGNVVEHRHESPRVPNVFQCFRFLVPLKSRLMIEKPRSLLIEQRWFDRHSFVVDRF